VFDRTSPPTRSVAQFEAFQKKVYTQSKSALIVLAGNHDSGDRIALNSTFADPARILIRGSLNQPTTPLILETHAGRFAFSALPYSEVYAAREYFADPDIGTPHDVLERQVQAARKHLPEDAHWVVIAHAFVTGGHTTESEKQLSVGGIETVSASVFEGASYVALGHLHRAQSAGAEHIRYSGSPLAFAFDESDTQKSMTLIDFDLGGISSITELPFMPKRPVKILHGQLADILQNSSSEDKNALIKAVLTDTALPTDPMVQLRKIYPHALILERDISRQPRQSKNRASSPLSEPEKVFEEFIGSIREDAFSKSEKKVLKAALSEVRSGQAD
jgi:exonuclease SbcD